MQAQACGVPVIGTRCSAITEKIPPGTGWLARGQRWWNPHHQAWWTIPNVRELTLALGKAARGQHAKPELIREHAMTYDADRVVKQDWAPVLEQLDGGLMASGELVYWWVVPPAQQSDSSRPSSAQLISTTTAGALYTALLGGGTGTYNGAQVSRFQGPFTSEAEARAANPAGGSEAQQIAAGAGAGLAAAGGVGAADCSRGVRGEPAARARGRGRRFEGVLLGGHGRENVAVGPVGPAGLWLMLAGILLWLKIPQRAATVGATAARAAI